MIDKKKFFTLTKCAKEIGVSINRIRWAQQHGYIPVASMMMYPAGRRYLTLAQVKEIKAYFDGIDILQTSIDKDSEEIDDGGESLAWVKRDYPGDLATQAWLLHGMNKDD